MNKIRVAHFCKSISYSGTDRTAQLFCKHLDKSKFDVYYLYNSNAAKERLYLVQDLLGKDKVVEIHHTDATNPQSPYYPASSNLWDVLCNLKLDILHVHHSGYGEWPVVPRVKELTKRVVATNIFGYSSQFDYLIDRKIYICDYIRERAGAPGSSTVIYNPVEIPSTIEDLREEFSLTKDELVLGRIGRADNFCPISLNALSRLKNIKGITPRYLVVNPCNKWRETTESLGLEDQVIFVPPIYDDERLFKFFNTIDILAHARSDGEVDSLSISQSLMAGKPIVTHVSGGFNGQIHQVVMSNAGLYANSATADDNYAAQLYLLMMSEDMRKDMGANAVRYAKEYLEASVITRQLEKVYHEIL